MRSAINAMNKFSYWSNKNYEILLHYPRILIYTVLMLSDFTSYFNSAPKTLFSFSSVKENTFPLKFDLISDIILFQCYKYSECFGSFKP